MTTQYYTLEDFRKVEKIDAHMHMWEDFDTLFADQAILDHFSLVNVSVFTTPTQSPRQQDEFSLSILPRYLGKVHFITTFSLEGFHQPGWVESVVVYLSEMVGKGAIGVKVWKNIGMDLRDKNGDFVMIDHPAFKPIIEFLIQQNIPLLAHLGEPKNTWLPLEQMTVQGDRAYFRENPEYHMFLHPEYPNYDQQIAARDRLLEKHPTLNFIGAHLGSLEWSVQELAKRLDRYPHMNVDLAERISHLQHQAVSDGQSVRDFLINYQDRILYGTDLRSNALDITTKGLTTKSDLMEHAHQVWLRHWRFFVTDEKMEAPKVTGSFRGMKLPKTVVDKIYRTNALRCYPKLAE
ncbi:amidohydrolase family protein [Lunatimonas salinarum]|uniref:amidohydrolase family protein n=1 Tax=Lunatimonas salinarum TaxID=1774590 RepID=UPI001ADF4DF1|nr:amidohydrolase family protein [Lunatimonas salinarum]